MGEMNFNNMRFDKNQNEVHKLQMHTHKYEISDNYENMNFVNMNYESDINTPTSFELDIVTICNSEDKLSSTPASPPGFSDRDIPYESNFFEIVENLEKKRENKNECEEEKDDSNTPMIKDVEPSLSELHNENLFTSYNLSIWNFNIIKSLNTKWKNYNFDNRFRDCKKLLKNTKFAKNWNNKTIREESKNLLSFKLNIIKNE